MVAFNPEPPDVQLPRQHSEPIQNFQLQSTTASAIKTGTEVFDSAIKATDEITKSFAEDEMYRRVTPVIEDRISQLEATKAVVKASNTDILAGPGDVSKQLPDELKKLPGVVDALKDARAKGTLSQTDFEGRLRMVAKDVRGNYAPGYRPYIDSLFAKAKGDLGANEYMTGLVGDINSYVTQAHAEREKVGNKILGSIGEDPSIAALYEGWRTGKVSSNEALTQVNNIKYNQVKIENATRAIQFESLNRSSQGARALEIGQSMVSQLAVNNLSALHISVGADNDQTVQQLFSKNNMDDVTAVNLRGEIAKQIPILAAQMTAKLKTPLSNVDGTPMLDKNGQALVPWNLMGADAAKKLVEDNLEGHKQYVSFLKDKEVSPAYMSSEISRAMLSVTERELFQDPNLGPMFLKLKTATNIIGSQAVGVLAEQIMAPDVTKRLRGYMANDKLSAAAGLPDKNGNMPSLAKDTASAASKGATGKDLNTYFQQVESIVDPKTPDFLKRNYVNYAFKDRGLIAQIEKDGINPATGDKTAGKYSIYNRLTDPAFVAAVKKLGGAEWDTYSAWNRDTFGNELIKPDVKAMNDIQIPENMKLIYDSDNKQYKVLDRSGRDILLTSRTFDFNPSAKRSLNNINSSLKRMAIVAEANGEDVDHYLFEQLKNMGLGESGNKFNGLPQNMIDSIVASRKKAEEEGETLAKPYKKKN